MLISTAVPAIEEKKTGEEVKEEKMTAVFLKKNGYQINDCRIIEQFGMCKIHRKSFHVKKFNLNQNTQNLF